MVKIWVINQIMTLKHQIQLGTVLDVVGKAKIKQLEDFYDLFNLDDISLEDVIYNGSDPTVKDTVNIVSHK
jgi:hypothetical protein